MTSPTIRVLRVDDHAVVRSGLSFFLSTTDDIEVVGEAADGVQALRLCAQLQPDVVLMDMVMPQMDGFTAMQQIRQRYPAIRVIALTSFLDGEFVQRALQGGASGYLLKDVQARDLADAIRAAYAGRSTLATEATQALIQTVAQPAQEGEALSEREREVLVRMARGLNNGEIAAQLMISTNTVRHHVRNILAKLEVTNRTEAVHVAMQRGLVE
jgi:two-component system, NarL family, response regulator LiaR